MAERTALVVGARGVVGTNLIEHLAADGGWDVIGLSRRGGAGGPGVRHIAVDLLDPAAMRDIPAELTGVTHVFYDPPHLPPEFNVAQQELLADRQRGGDWTWTAIRPSVVCGTALGNPMNLAMVIGVYASLCRELRVPLRFPGKPGAYTSLLEMTDAGLLAAATVWAATDPRCANQAFNIANGDLFRWEEMWPRIAGFFDLDVAPPLPMPLADVMSDKEPAWHALARRHGLRANYDEVSSWAFGDFVFSWDYDMFADTSKSRRFGFHRYVDTFAMFEQAFATMRRDRIIP